MRRRSSLHLIPATILAASLVLTVKLGSIWQAFSGEEGAELLSIAVAEEQPEEAPRPETEAKAAAETAALQAELAKVAPGRLDAGRPGPAFSSAEVDLLQKLAARREELDERERELDLREGLLKAAEQQLERSSKELEALQKRVEGLVEQHNEQENKRLESLVSIYEKMKPKDAARIMNELEMDVLLDVMNRMKDAKAAGILADMDPVRAREVTTRLADRRSLTDPEERS